MGKRGRPPLGKQSQTGAERQRRWRARFSGHSIRVEAWVKNDVALFFEGLAHDARMPVHRAMATALEEFAVQYRLKKVEDR